MNLTNSLSNAKITKIAIIDDDWKNTISFSDIEKEDYRLSSKFVDIDDPLYSEIKNVINSAGFNIEPDCNSIPSFLLHDNVYSNLPEEIKNTINRIVEKKKGFKIPLELIKDILTQHGIDNSNIKTFSSREDIDFNEKFDLIFIDYFLHENDTKESKEIISSFIRSHQTANHPLLFVLMSSYESQLSKDFHDLRPSLSISSSRFRIMKKSVNASEIDKLEWMLAINQLVNERNLAPKIERFISLWQDKLQDATSRLQTSLWDLDADCIKILAETANADSLGLDKYITEILSRRLLAAMEEGIENDTNTNELSTELLSDKIFFPSYEIKDSRTFLRKLSTDLNWHKNSQRQYDDTLSKPDWFKDNIKFGTVLRIDSDIYVNVSQPCDIAHTNDFDNSFLLFIKGELDSINSTERPGEKTLITQSVEYNDDWYNIHWHLNKPKTLSIRELINIIPKVYLIGQLRQDIAQSIIVKYASQASRVGLIRFPKFGQSQAIPITINKIDSSNGITYDFYRADIKEIKLSIKIIKGDDKNESLFHINDDGTQCLLAHFDQKTNRFIKTSHANIDSIEAFIKNSIMCFSFYQKQSDNYLVQLPPKESLNIVSITKNINKENLVNELTKGICKKYNKEQIKNFGLEGYIEVDKLEDWIYNISTRKINDVSANKSILVINEKGITS
ncbi:hypothetical protein WCT96_15985 [Pectobacterium carotovorum]|uniref:hypothetical protein n=1 Tax=Pectobacterium carotovorum TaxID=554 RepID=UPI0030159CD8